jgi:CTP:molybdopterin cytidylyltransferase MocA
LQLPNPYQLSNNYTRKLCSALVPAAGTSGRMGYPKLFLPFLKNKTFLEEIVSQYLRFGCEKVVVVVNQKDMINVQSISVLFGKPDIKFVVNPNPENGRFASIQLGLKEIGAENDVFMQNIDNPFVDLDLLTTLLESLNPRCWSVPVFNKRRGHPLCMSREVADVVRKCIDRDVDIRKIIANFDCSEIEAANNSILLNINTPEDYVRVFKKNFK